MILLVKAAQVKWLNGVKFALPLVFAVGLLPACSANWHLKKAIAKDPSILIPQSVRVDTTIVTPTVAITDTFVMNVMDTIILEKERLRVRLVRSYDTIQIDAACASDTIRITKEVMVPQVVYTNKPWDGWSIGGWLLMIILIFATIRFIADKVFS